MIKIENIEFTYSGRKIPTLIIPHLEVGVGERVFLFGPSGTGKTTLLEHLAGVLVSQKGHVFLADKNLNEMSDKQRDEFRARNIGYIFQSFNLLPYLTVLENVLLPLSLKGDDVNQAVVSEAKELLQRLGLNEQIDEVVTLLSIGQQQRVALARALIGRPAILLADEPTSSLDYDHREKFLNVLFELCQQYKTTLIFVSHDRSLMQMFDRVIDLSLVNLAKKSEVNA